VEEDRIYKVYAQPQCAINESRNRTYIVAMDTQAEDYSCICCKFQKDGILCSHILKVMMKKDISKIPDKYIIQRWRKKETKMFYTRPASLLEEASALRYNNLSLMAAEMVAEGSKTEEQHNYLSKEIERITMELKKMRLDKEKQQEGATTTDENIQSNQDIELLDPDVAQTKGRSKKSNKRAMPMVERIKETQKKKYTCQNCKNSGHNTSTCTAKPKETGHEDTTEGKYPPPLHTFSLNC
jgi:hypothetical protein